MSNGWIKLHRSLQDNPLWTCEPFTRGQAWVDILMTANHQHSFFFKRGIKIDVERGQLARSEVELADKWKWSRTKVRKFLKDLEKEQQVIQQKTFVTQVLTIVNYEFYQEKEQQVIQQKDSRKTAERQQKDTYKNVKKNKNVNNDNKQGFEFQDFFDSSQLASTQFKTTWLEWLEYLKTDKRHPLKKTGAKKQLKLLAESDIETAIEMLETSMRNNWQGIFPLNGNSKAGVDRNETAVTAFKDPSQRGKF